MKTDALVSHFLENFPSAQPALFKAPGRINLIGEHTDYNLGYVLPAAIDKAMYFAVAPRTDSQVEVVAMDLGERVSWKLGERPPVSTGWVAYVLGMVELLQQGDYPIQGFSCVFGGDIPIGAGVSSSAALSCGIGYALNSLMDLQLDRWELIHLAQQTEHQYAGVKCGIMDMFASTYGKKDHVIRLDCRSMEYVYVPFELKGHAIVLCNSQVSHSLASTEYNTRREQCEAGVRVIAEKFPEVLSLRDVKPRMLESMQSILDELVFKRCEYILEENQRVLDTCDALEAGDLHAMGAYMYKSHAGLQYKYEVSCPELDFLVDQTRPLQGVLGARMMGGGFGGCTLNIVAKDYLDEFARGMKKGFQESWGRDLPIYILQPGDGVGAYKPNRIKEV